MTLRFRALAIATPDPTAVARFWADLLERDVVEDRRGLLLPGDATQVGLRFEADPAAVSHPEQVHLHVTSDHARSQGEVVEHALALGASHLDVGQQLDEDHVVLADPDGHAFCVIEPGNGYLARTGVLGELACDGTREVGVFWSEALGWPLVWDQDGETAIQSPAGGTKVAWGGPPLNRHDGDRLWFDLTTGDVGAETDRLVALGASDDTVIPGGVALRDPDGSRFTLTFDRSGVTPHTR